METKQRFDPAPPPRRVPLTVRTYVIFGGLKNQLIWMATIFGFAGFSVFGFQSDFTSFFAFRGGVEKAPGIITGSGDSGYSEGGSRLSHGTSIFENRYTFTGPDGKKYKGASYSVGKQLKKGDKISIEFRKGNPSVSRIPGMRCKALGPLAGIVTTILWLGFLLIAVVFFREGRRSVRLLRTGKPARGKFKSKVNIYENRPRTKPYYRMEFEFASEDGRTFVAKAETFDPAPLEDEQTEPLLYDPHDPPRAALIGAMPGDPDFDERGQLRPGSFGKFLAVLIMPGLSVMMNGILILVLIGMLIW